MKLPTLTLDPKEGVLVLDFKNFPFDLDALTKSATAVYDEEGLLTLLGRSVVARYAVQWVGGVRAVQLEREFPELGDLFYDLRLDSELARRHAG